MPDWIHTRRGVTLVEGTLLRLARGLERLAELLDPKEARYEVYMQLVWNGDAAPGGDGWEPFAASDQVRYHPEGALESMPTVFWRRRIR